MTGEELAIQENRWKEAQSWEKNWHGRCINTYREETKQLVYARKMGLEISDAIDCQNKSIIDIGGGCVSLLLKTKNLRNGMVWDPLFYPDWVYERYEAAGLKYWHGRGENLDPDTIYDEVWIYNCLQHTINPEQVIKSARKRGAVIRIFEWIDIPTNIGHIHTLTEENLDKWLGGKGSVEYLDEYGCNGKAYFGVFKGDPV